MDSKLLFRRLVLFGAPLFTGIVLLFHPRPSSFPQPGVPFDVFGFIAPAATRFVIVHILLAPALGLLGLAMFLLLGGMRGRLVTISRVATAVFIVAYIVYESIVGTATGSMVRHALSLPPTEQKVIADAAVQMWTDPIVGDAPGVISQVAFAAWTIAIVTAAIALGRAGAPIPACVLLVLSFGLTLHALPTGPIGMLCFLLAAIWMEQSAAKIKRSEPMPMMATAAASD
jgi:hypothetical protein